MSSPLPPAGEHPDSELDDEPEEPGKFGHRVFSLGIVVALALAFMGWVTSTNAPGPAITGRHPKGTTSVTEKAQSYVELRERRRGLVGHQLARGCLMIHHLYKAYAL